MKKEPIRTDAWFLEKCKDSVSSLRDMRVFVLIFLFQLSGLFSQVGNFDDPVSISLHKRKGNEYEIHLRLKDGYAFQKEAPHRILLSGKNGVSVINAKLVFQGPTHSLKPEYFSQVDPLPITLTGTGDLEVHGRLFYCSFAKNLCIPGKLNTILKVN